MFRAEKPRRANSFRHHRHSAFEISLILSGSGNYLIDGVNYPIAVGDIFIHATNVPHCITDSSGESVMRLVSIKFEPRYFWTSFDEAEYMQCFFLRVKRAGSRIPSGTELNEVMKRLILAAERESEEKAAGWELLLRSHVLNMLILMTREESRYYDMSKVPQVTEQRLRGLSASVDYICEHFTEPLTLDRIAKSAGLSRNYYCTVFRQLTGAAPWDYVNLKRIEAAMRILREEDLNILDVAMRCGFNNTANFNRIFKKYTSLTPLEYRRTHTYDAK